MNDDIARALQAANMARLAFAAGGAAKPKAASDDFMAHVHKIANDAMHDHAAQDLHARAAESGKSLGTSAHDVLMRALAIAQKAHGDVEGQLRHVGENAASGFQKAKEWGLPNLVYNIESTAMSPLRYIAPLAEDGPAISAPVKAALEKSKLAAVARGAAKYNVMHPQDPLATLGHYGTAGAMAGTGAGVLMPPILSDARTSAIPAEQRASARFDEMAAGTTAMRDRLANLTDPDYEPALIKAHDPYPAGEHESVPIVHRPAPLITPPLQQQNAAVRSPEMLPDVPIGVPHPELGEGHVEPYVPDDDTQTGQEFADGGAVGRALKFAREFAKLPQQHEREFWGLQKKIAEFPETNGKEFWGGLEGNLARNATPRDLSGGISKAAYMRQIFDAQNRARILKPHAERYLDAREKGASHNDAMDEVRWGARHESENNRPFVESVFGDKYYDNNRKGFGDLNEDRANGGIVGKALAFVRGKAPNGPYQGINDFLDEKDGPNNKWLDAGDYSAYLRKSDYTGTKRVELANVNRRDQTGSPHRLPEGERGERGHFGEFMDALEDAARKRGYKQSYVENVINEFLPEKLEARGYERDNSYGAQGPYHSYKKNLARGGGVDGALKIAYDILNGGHDFRADQEPERGDRWFAGAPGEGANIPHEPEWADSLRLAKSVMQPERHAAPVQDDSDQTEALNRAERDRVQEADAEPYGPHLARGGKAKNYGDAINKALAMVHGFAEGGDVEGWISHRLPDADEHGGAFVTGPNEENIFVPHNLLAFNGRAHPEIGDHEYIAQAKKYFADNAKRDGERARGDEILRALQAAQRVAASHNEGSATDKAKARWGVDKPIAKADGGDVAWGGTKTFDDMRFTPQQRKAIELWHNRPANMPDRAVHAAIADELGPISRGHLSVVWNNARKIAAKHDLDVDLPPQLKTRDPDPVREKIVNAANKAEEPLSESALAERFGITNAGARNQIYRARKSGQSVKSSRRVR